ncbi:MAG: sulfite exporter TauE/SafE family protein [Phyllobacteriaceae bacterium]|nr:sulfite exporter TauE/SafE family protein [Phyllobacteriaceae bacterium]
MDAFFSDPWFWAAALPAVFLVGLSKGGFGGSMGFVGVPLMSLAMPPLQAAAILLPIMILMDIVALWSWRGVHDRRTLAYMLPGSMLGIAIGGLLAAQVTVAAIRLAVGAVAIVFVGRWLHGEYVRKKSSLRGHDGVRATFWSAVSGFTSFVAHVGGPPFQIYVLPLGLDPKTMTGTSVVFFAVTNAVKLIPYFALGQFDATNLAVSAALTPIAPAATLLGAWLVRRMRPEVFYPFTYAVVGVIALKLVWDGVAALL